MTERIDRAGPSRLTDGKRRSAGSRRWLERQLSDPYVAAARKRGYRSRSAFKLIELDDRFHLLRPGARVVDLGAAPGGWTQVAIERVAPGRPTSAAVIAVDTSAMGALQGAAILQADIADPGLITTLLATLAGPVDVVLSDMAPASSGHASADHLRIMGLAEAALDVASAILAPGGHFVCKVWQGGTEAALLGLLKRLFRTVRHAKPPASRPESPELYVVAMGFRGAASGGQ